MSRFSYLLSVLLYAFLAGVIFFIGYLKDSVLLILLASITALLLLIKLRDWFSRRQVAKQFAVQESNPGRGDFVSTSPRIYSSSQKQPHAVLFIHGFSASPDEGRDLFDRLEANGIPYYAPALTGFGLDDFHLLSRIKYSDWLRDVHAAYDVLAESAESVSIVGHSMGALLALLLAQEKPVRNLVLSVPYIVRKKKHNFSHLLLSYPVVSEFLTTLNPLIFKGSKKKQPMCMPPFFVYDYVPIRAIQAMWVLQDMLQIKSIQARSVTALFGALDNTTDKQLALEALSGLHVPLIEYEFPKSGHTLLRGPEMNEVISQILAALRT